MLLIGSACGHPPPSACTDDGRLEVGAGGARLLALPESGGQLSIVHGPQGGIHVLVGVWVRDLSLDMELTYRLEEPSDGSMIGAETLLSLDPSLFSPDGTRYQRNPDLIVLDNASPDATPYDGRTARLIAQAQAGSEWVCDARLVTLVDSL
jgi:hypothetical protein